MKNGPRLAAVFPWIILAATLFPTSSSGAQLETGEFQWSQEVTSKSTVQQELARLYVELYEKTSLPTRSIKIENGNNVTDVLIRSGAWPAWLKNWSPRILESLMCDLNPKICSRAKRPSSSISKLHDMASLKGTALTRTDWTRAWPGREMIVPAVSLELAYTFGARKTSQFNPKTTDVPIETTSDLLQLWCRNNPTDVTSCQGRTIKANWRDTEPRIFQYLDDGKIPPEKFSKIAATKSLKRFGAKNSSIRLSAVPILRAKLSVKPRALENLVGTSQSLNERILIQRKIQLQSNGAVHQYRRLQRRMGLRSKDGAFLKTWPEDRPVSPIRIVHIDQEAELKHCAFRELVQSGKLRLERWNFATKNRDVVTFLEEETGSTDVPSSGPSTEGGENTLLVGTVATEAETTQTASTEMPVPTDGPSTELSVDCGAVSEHVQENGNHGTHTLGVLVELLSREGADRVFGGGEPPVTIIHVPNPDGTDAPVEGGLNLLIEAINNTVIWGADLVNMSVSWPRTGMRPLEQAIERLDGLVLFVVAAGNNSDDTGCSVTPACMSSDNVVSVIGLDLDDDDALVLANRSNSGRDYHDIGAIGTNILATVKGGKRGVMSGTSQATPIVTAAFSYMMRLGITDFAKLKERLLITAQLESSLLNASTATLIDVRRALQFGTDHAILRDGCVMTGEFQRLTGDDTIRAEARETEAIHSISTDNLLRVFYNNRRDTHVIMYTKNEKLYRRDFVLEAEDRAREFVFFARTAEGCSGVQNETLQRFNISQVKDFIRPKQ